MCICLSVFCVLLCVCCCCFFKWNLIFMKLYTLLVDKIVIFFFFSNALYYENSSLIRKEMQNIDLARKPVSWQKDFEMCLRYWRMYSAFINTRPVLNIYYRKPAGDFRNFLFVNERCMYAILYTFLILKIRRLVI